MDAQDQQDTTYIADAVAIDLAANAIRIQVRGYPAADGPPVPATLDVGANGRLIGLEIDDHYISVMNMRGADDLHVRSAEVLVTLSAESPPWISIPRRGAGYEITYPSGNECWQMQSVDGELIQVCSTIDAAPGALRDAIERRTTRLHHPGTGRESPGQR